MSREIELWEYLRTGKQLLKLILYLAKAITVDVNILLVS